MENIVERFANLLSALSTPDWRTLDIGDDKFAFRPDGFSIVNVSEHTDHVRRVDGVFDLHRVAAFEAYWARFNRENSVVFADLQNHKLTAFIDYHSPKGEPAHCAHIALFSPKVSEAFNCWRRAAGAALEQRAFQRFLEDRRRDVKEPDGAALLELVGDLEATMRIQASDVERLDNGSRKISYTKENVVAGDVVIPPGLKLSIPIFEGEPAQDVDVVLRWDIDADTHKAKFTFEILNVAELMQSAFMQAVSTVEATVGERFFWGDAH